MFFTYQEEGRAKEGKKQKRQKERTEQRKGESKRGRKRDGKRESEEKKKEQKRRSFLPQEEQRRKFPKEHNRMRPISQPMFEALYHRTRRYIVLSVDYYIRRVASGWLIHSMVSPWSVVDVPKPMSRRGRKKKGGGKLINIISISLRTEAD